MVWKKSLGLVIYTLSLVITNGTALRFKRDEVSGTTRDSTSVFTSTPSYVFHEGELTSLSTTVHEHSDSDGCQTVLPSYADDNNIIIRSNFIFPPTETEHSEDYYEQFYLERSIFFINWWAPFERGSESSWPSKPIFTTDFSSPAVSSDLSSVYNTDYQSPQPTLSFSPTTFLLTSFESTSVISKLQDTTGTFQKTTRFEETIIISTSSIKPYTDSDSISAWLTRSPVTSFSYSSSQSEVRYASSYTVATSRATESVMSSELQTESLSFPRSLSVSSSNTSETASDQTTSSTFVILSSSKSAVSTTTDSSLTPVPATESISPKTTELVSGDLSSLSSPGVTSTSEIGSTTLSGPELQPTPTQILPTVYVSVSITSQAFESYTLSKSSLKPTSATLTDVPSLTKAIESTTTQKLLPLSSKSPKVTEFITRSILPTVSATDSSFNTLVATSSLLSTFPLSVEPTSGVKLLSESVLPSISTSAITSTSEFTSTIISDTEIRSATTQSLPSVSITVSTVTLSESQGLPDSSTSASTTLQILESPRMSNSLFALTSASVTEVSSLKTVTTVWTSSALSSKQHSSNIHLSSTAISATARETTNDLARSTSETLSSLKISEYFPISSSKIPLSTESTLSATGLKSDFTSISASDTKLQMSTEQITPSVSVPGSSVNTFEKTPIILSTFPLSVEITSGVILESKSVLPSLSTSVVMPTSVFTSSLISDTEMHHSTTQPLPSVSIKVSTMASSRSESLSDSSTSASSTSHMLESSGIPSATKQKSEFTSTFISDTKMQPSTRQSTSSVSGTVSKTPFTFTQTVPEESLSTSSTSATPVPPTLSKSLLESTSFVFSITPTFSSSMSPSMSSAMSEPPTSTPVPITTQAQRPLTTTPSTSQIDAQSDSGSDSNLVPMIAGGAAAAVVVIGGVVGVVIYLKLKAASAVGSLPGAASYNAPSVPGQASYNSPNQGNTKPNNNQNNHQNTRGDRNTKDGPGKSKAKLPKNMKNGSLAPMQNAPPQPPSNNGLWLGNNEPLPSISGQFPGGQAGVPAASGYGAPNVPGPANYSGPTPTLFNMFPGGQSGVPASGAYTNPNIPGPASY